jgi:unsaturated rhamnogalacturonyl hydrolase
MTVEDQRDRLLRAAAEQTMKWHFRTWAFGESIALRGLLAASRRLGERRFLGFAEGLVRGWIRRASCASFEDHAAPGLELLSLHAMTGDRDYLSAALQLAQLVVRFPRAISGVRLHRPDLAGWNSQIWVDCLHLDPPFLSELGLLTGTSIWIEEAEQMLRSYSRLLQDDSTGLFWHGHEEHAGRNGQPWARGNGWALLGLVETIPTLEKAGRDTTDFRASLLRLARGLRDLQTPAGLWHTALNAIETYEESTLATIAAYAFPHAFRSGLLPFEEFAACSRLAERAVLKLVDEEGRLARVSDATPIGDLQNYATRPFGIFPWGQGPLLLLLSEESYQ